MHPYISHPGNHDAYSPTQLPARRIRFLPKSAMHFLQTLYSRCLPPFVLNKDSPVLHLGMFCFFACGRLIRISSEQRKYVPPRNNTRKSFSHVLSIQYASASFPLSIQMCLDQVRIATTNSSSQNFWILLHDHHQHHHITLGTTTKLTRPQIRLITNPLLLNYNVQAHQRSPLSLLPLLPLPALHPKPPLHSLSPEFPNLTHHNPQPYSMLRISVLPESIHVQHHRTDYRTHDTQLSGAFPHGLLLGVHCALSESWC